MTDFYSNTVGGGTKERTVNMPSAAHNKIFT